VEYYLQQLTVSVFHGEKLGQKPHPNLSRPRLQRHVILRACITRHRCTVPQVWDYHLNLGTRFEQHRRPFFLRTAIIKRVYVMANQSSVCIQAQRNTMIRRSFMPWYCKPNGECSTSFGTSWILTKETEHSVGVTASTQPTDSDQSNMQPPSTVAGA
jgi:hypothetical protein